MDVFPEFTEMQKRKALEETVCTTVAKEKPEMRRHQADQSQLLRSASPQQAGYIFQEAQVRVRCGFDVEAEEVL